MTVEVHAIEGLPEVRPGDDLAALLAPELRARGARDGDVVAVTSKIVSKAEGRLIPGDDRTEAVARETVRVVAQRGDLVIAETAHGFVCANGGVDASNVGPRSGDIVTLLPVDPDASAARIRESVRSRFGVDVPVIVSDSFGRPWRWGIVDVAIGVSGLVPIEDLRGSADHDGRVMRSTIRAVADELASAAELAFGKIAGRPVALIRGASPTRGEGSIRDVLMPPANDLFR